MAPKPFRYWTNSLYDNSESALPTPDPSVNGMLASRSTTDTLLRSIWVWKLAARFDTAQAGAPPIYWWQDAAVYADVIIDLDGSGPVGDIADDDPRRIGIDLLKVAKYTAQPEPTGRDVVVWETSVGIMNLETGRAGLGLELPPQVFGRLWAVDHMGVFVGGYGTHATFQVYGYGRALWASEFPAP
jgi:hypothetical protein